MSYGGLCFGGPASRPDLARIWKESPGEREIPATHIRGGGLYAPIQIEPSAEMVSSCPADIVPLMSLPTLTVTVSTVGSLKVSRSILDSRLHVNSRSGYATSAPASIVLWALGRGSH